MPDGGAVAYGVLVSILALLVLLIRGRQSPAMLFALWAGAYFLLGLVDQKTFLASYANPALATLILLLLVSLALERSPVLDRLSAFLVNGRPFAAGLRLSLLTLPFSAFLNNTAVVGALLGVVTRQNRISPSKLLIPLSYASILGGVTTLVGTSTNLVVNSFAVKAGLPALGMFQLAWVGVPVALVCVVVMLTMIRWLPEHANQRANGGQSYFLEARLLADSPLSGRSVEANGLRNLDGLFLVEVLRAGRLISPVGPEEILAAGDILIFSGETEKVQALRGVQGLEVFGTNANHLLRDNLVEAVISNQSELDNKTLREVDFRSMFDAAVVGIRRGERRLTGQLGRIPLRVGDCLLLAVGPDFHLHRNIDRNFHVLDGSLLRPRLSNRQNWVALSGFAAVILCSALGLLPLFSGLMLLMFGLLVSGALSVADLRRRFPFDLYLTIASALTIAEVLERSGAAALVAGVLRDAFSAYGVTGALVGVYLVTVLLTELITNNAAAALAFPIGLSAAKAFGVDPTPFVMIVAYGASACFLLPFGYQTHLMVYSPGRYRMLDFIRTGLPVSVAYGVAVLLLVPVFFPFSK